MTKHHCIVWYCVVLGLLQNVVDLQAQGTTFFSNLGQTPTGNSAIATDSWYAEEFITGTNAGGYVLNSVQLRMASPTGSPLGFSVSVYQGIIPPFGSNDAPGTYLQSLSGNDPATSGVFTFQSPGLILSPFTVYFVVTTARTSMTSGAFNWSKTTGNFTPAGHDPWAVRGILYQSSDGVSWQGMRSDIFQLAINATAVPEPTSSAMLGLGGSFLFTRLARKSRSKVLRQP